MNELLEAWLKTLEAVKTLEITNSKGTHFTDSWEITYKDKQYKIIVEEIIDYGDAPDDPAPEYIPIRPKYVPVQKVEILDEIQEIRRLLANFPKH